MTLHVREVEAGDSQLLGRLVDLYLHDFSEFDGRDLQADGSYHYRWLKAYETEGDRRAYLFFVESFPAGFALIRLTDPIELADFFVVRKYRRSGIGTLAARDVIGRHPGHWAVNEVSNNSSATSFRRRSIPVAFHEYQGADGHMEQTFTVNR
jgi:predicted acetyltransferase